MPPSSSTVADVALRAVSSLHVKEGEGVLVTSSETRFQDAQGNRIPTGGMRGEVAQQRLGRKRCDSQRERGLQFKGHAAHLVLWKTHGARMENQWKRTGFGEWRCQGTSTASEFDQDIDRAWSSEDHQQRR